MHNTQKKQNRILLAALVVILASAAILIAVTGSANRKNNTEKPPLDIETDAGNESDTDSANQGNTNPTIKPERIPLESEALDGKDDKSSMENEKTDAAAETDADKEVSSILDSALPVFSAPVDGVVIKDYSDNLPVFSYTMNDYRTHGGLDFACSAGAPVYAAADGVVCELTDDPMMGITVAIQHSGGAITKYKGLSQDSLEMKKIGDEVRRGDVIGTAGDTALIESAEESHLHFELTVEGTAVDPADYMNVSFLSELYED